jgi:hypothetical protein
VLLLPRLLQMQRPGASATAIDYMLHELPWRLSFEKDHLLLAEEGAVTPYQSSSFAGRALGG